MKSSYRFSLLLAVVCMAWCQRECALAQVSPQLGYVYPPSVVIGQETPVQLGGYDFTEDLQWFVHDPQVTLQVSGRRSDYQLAPPPYWIGPRAGTDAPPIPREFAGQFLVDKTATPGLVRWQVANANGSSQTACVLLTRDPDVLEKRSRDLPQQLPTLPVAVCGRLSRLTEVDCYVFTAEGDGPVSIALMARQLGSNFHGHLQVHNADGTLLSDFADTRGRDGALTFFAKAGGRYTVSLRDVDFRGHRAYVYRLSITPGPRVICTRPAYGPRGSTADVEFIGYGLVSGQNKLETLHAEVTFPSDTSTENHTHELPTKFGKVPVTIPLSDLPEAVTAQTNEKSAEDAQPPFAVTSRFATGEDVREFRWQAAADAHWQLDVQSQAIGGSLDVAVCVRDSTGKQILDIDDSGNHTDATARFITKTAGEYTCIVRSMASRRGTADEIFRLALRRQSPGFTLHMPQQIKLPSGGKTTVKISADRTGGFDGPITITPVGLPAGVQATGEWTIPAGKNNLNGTLEASPNAAVVAASIAIQGTAELNGKTVTKQAGAAVAGNLCPRGPTDAELPVALLSMTMPAPFTVKIVDRERQRDVPRGTTYLAEIELERDDGFAGDVAIEMTAKQSRNRQGIRGTNIVIPADSDRGFYPCFMPEWLGTDLTRRMIVHGVATVNDPQGHPRQLTAKSDARITMILEGALLKLNCPATELTLTPGEPLQIPVVLSRSVKLPLPTEVRLGVPDELKDVLQAESLTLPVGTDRGQLQVTTRPDERLTGSWTFTLSATALQDGRWPVVSQTQVDVEVIAPQQ